MIGLIIMILLSALIAGSIKEELEAADFADAFRKAMEE